MTRALKRYKDGTYIPLAKPWVKRVHYGDASKNKKRGIVRRTISKMLDNAAEGIIRSTGLTRQEHLERGGI